MAEYEKKVREVLKQHGFTFHHHGKGDHDVWVKASVKVTVDGKIKSRHMANHIMKKAGIDLSLLSVVAGARHGASADASKPDTAPFMGCRPNPR